MVILKITLISQFMPPEMEPSGFMFSSLSRHLAKKGNVERVDILCGFPNFPEGKFKDRAWLKLFKDYVDEGVIIHNVIVYPSSNKSNLKRIVNYVSFLFSSLIRGMLLPKMDVVVATSPPIFAGLAGLILAKLKGAKFVLDVRDIWPESAVQMGSIHNRFVIRVLERLELLLYRHSSLIAVATPGMVDLVREKIPDVAIPVHYIPCGVRIPEKEELEVDSKSPFKVEDSDKFCVLYAGLHGHAQNLTTIVDAAKKLEFRTDIVFYFIGAGPDKDRVVNYAKVNDVTNIRFLEPVSREKIRNYFLFSGCAIVPLQDLNIFKNVFPSKTFELMSYGVPSVVGVGGEIGRLIDDTGSGISVEPECVQQYAEAILQYADNSVLRERVKRNALKTAASQFDYEVVNERFFKLIDNILIK